MTATTFIVIQHQLLYSEEYGNGDAYTWDGRFHPAIAVAIRAGFRVLDHDDFNIGGVKDGRLVWFGWQYDQQPDADLVEIARHLALDPPPPVEPGVIERIATAIAADQEQQADAVDPEVGGPSSQYLAGYDAATARAVDVVRSMAIEDGDS